MAKRKRGTQFKKRPEQTNPILRYFEQFTRPQIIAMLLVADAQVATRNRILARLGVDVLTEDEKIELAQLPYQNLVEQSGLQLPDPHPQAVQQVASVATTSGDESFGPAETSESAALPA